MGRPAAEVVRRSYLLVIRPTPKAVPWQEPPRPLGVRVFSSAVSAPPSCWLADRHRGASGVYPDGYRHLLTRRDLVMLAGHGCEGVSCAMRLSKAP